jgi:hypothetical protein
VAIDGVPITGNLARFAGGGVCLASTPTGTLTITAPSLVSGNIAAVGKADVYRES